MKIEDVLLKTRKVLLMALCFAFSLGFFETLYSVFGIGIAKKIIDVFNYFPFVEKDLFQERISSIGNEPPDLALFLISICTWMLSYIYTNKGYLRYFPIFMVVFLTYYSGSRTALIVILFQIILFLYLITPKNLMIKYVRNFAVITVFLAFFLAFFESEKIVMSFESKIESLNFSKNLTKNISNQSRFGIQYATLQVFLDHPIIGVGYGQQSFYSRHYYPGWAKKNNYEFEYKYENSALRSFPPAYNLYTRILAETGIIGFSIFVLLLLFSLHSINSFIKKTKDKNLIIYLMVLYTTIISLYLNWFQNDTFKIYVLWLSLVIFIKIKKENTEQLNY